MRRLAAALAVGAALMVTAGSGADTGSVTWSGNGNQTVAAVDASGGPATINVSAADSTLTVNCDHSSGTFPLGSTQVHCTATDSGGTEVGTTDFTITVTDQTAPVVTVPADITANATSPAGLNVTFSPLPSASDNVDGPLTPTCAPLSSGATFPLGQTTVTCRATDNAGNQGSAAFKVTVSLVDNTPPVVTVPGNISGVATVPAGKVETFTATATDNLDGSITPTCGPFSSGATFPIGTTTETCQATDSHGNTGSAAFSVTITDGVPPQLTVPANQTVGATSPAGAVVTYSPLATDNVGVTSLVCAPASGSTFPAKQTTTVTCTAKDAAGNQTQKSFTVTVNDSAPVLTHVDNIVAEANSPSGAAVTYTPPSATDVVDGGLSVTCAPASGTTFALGATTVNCSATNSSNQTSTTSFGVLVRDTTPPVMPIPGTISLTSDSPVPATNELVARFLNVRATDLVDPSPKVRSNSPGVFPFGRTIVTFTASDKSGNTSTATGTVVVVQAQAPTPAPVVTPGTTPPDRKPPANVRNLTIRMSGHSAILRWRPPTADFSHVVITRSAGGKKGVVVYRGAKSTFTDHRLKMGVAYRYLVVAVDKTGNQSAGIAALARPAAQPLFGPATGQRVTSPVVLRWRAKKGATFYNVQLYRAKTKVLSAWPKSAKIVVNARWSYGGKTQQLLPGRYTWYVWPARGTRKTPKYQTLEGFNSFVVVNA